MKAVVFDTPADHTQALVLAAVIVVFIFFALTRSGSHFRYRRRRRAFRPFVFNPRFERDLSDVGEQLKAVMSASFEKQRILSVSEYRLFSIVEREIAARRSGHRVFAQTNLGEILRSADEDAFHSINSKRVDILVVDRNGWPILAIEYQGKGHYQGSAAARDAVKKEALRKAGVRYVEFGDGDSDGYIRLRLREYLPESSPIREQSPESPDATTP